MNNIILNFNKKIFFFKEKEFSTLLVTLEKYHIQIEYQCRSGYCGACRCNLISGEIYWLIQPLAVIDQGEILLCCCKAKGNIEIKI